MARHLEQNQTRHVAGSCSSAAGAAGGQSVSLLLSRPFFADSESCCAGTETSTAVETSDIDGEASERAETLSIDEALAVALSDDSGSASPWSALAPLSALSPLLAPLSPLGCVAARFLALTMTLPCSASGDGSSTIGRFFLAAAGLGAGG